MADDFTRLKVRLREFARARNWEQFHNPKNLVMALSVEAAELVEHFQWLTAEQAISLTDEQKKEVALEMADIIIYLSRLSDQLDIDLLSVINEKIAINEDRFPPDVVAGNQDHTLIK